MATKKYQLELTAGLAFHLISIALLIVFSFILFEQSIQGFINNVIATLSSTENTTLVVLFIITCLALDILLPVPSSLVAVFGASTLGFTLGASSIWLGLMLGSAFGYLLGHSSSHYFFRHWGSANKFEKSRHLSQKIGTGALIAMRGVPVLAETSVIAAGLTHYPFARFMLVMGLANAGLALSFAYIGNQAGEQGSFLIALAGSVAIPIMAWGLKSIWEMIHSKTITSPRSISKIRAINAQFSINYDYPVLFEHDVFSSSNPCLTQLLTQTKRVRGVVVWVDKGVVQAFPELVEKITHYFEHHERTVDLLAAVQIIEGGEAAKQAHHIETMYEVMLKHHVDRHCVVIVIGGGAVLDAAGYACATFHRGVQLLRMPSTVLAQNDVGVSVKNGFNAFNKKNLIGTFSPPMAVVNDSALLQGLTARDQLAGLAETIKVAVIRSSTFFNWIEANAQALARFEPGPSQYAIAHCAELHLTQITSAGDPFENGSARPLDYGHWSAHKLESLTHYQVRHGEAVAIGMALDACYAVKIGMLAHTEATRLINLLQTLGFTLWHPALMQQDANGQATILHGLEEFREHLGGDLCITLPTSMGQAQEVNHIQMSALIKSLDTLQQLAMATDMPHAL